MKCHVCGELFKERQKIIKAIICNVLNGDLEIEAENFDVHFDCFDKNLSYTKLEIQVVERNNLLGFLDG